MASVQAVRKMHIALLSPEKSNKGQKRNINMNIVIVIVKNRALCCTEARPVYEINVALRPQRPYGLLRTGGAQDGHLDFHTAPELCGPVRSSGSMLLYVHRDH